MKPFNRFLSAVETVVSNCPKPEAGNVGPIAIVKRGDARNLDIEDASIDLVLTSPPYLNGIDYLRCSKPLDWAATQDNLGTALRALGERESGTKNLDAAVEAFREALKERTRERFSGKGLVPLPS